MDTNGTPSDDEPSARERILAQLESGIDDLSAAIDAAHPETDVEEGLQLRRYHEIGYLANQYRKLKRDTELDEMDERLALLAEDLDNPPIDE